MGPMTWLADRVRPVQRAFGEVIRSKVAGSDAEERGRQIWGKAGDRWFGPEDPIWRVHEDASMFAGGIAALLMQALHPLAMAGVAGHSGYRTDPWGRLRRTSDYIAITTYAPIPDAEELIDHVRTVHSRVRGKDHRGRPYRASDPHLLAWVHAAEIDAFFSAFQAYGIRPLSDPDADLYVAQTAIPARLLGVPEPPTTVADLAEVLESFRPELETSPDALDTVDFLLRTPPLPWLARPGYGMLAAGAVALLPPWARDMLGIAWPDDLVVRLGRPTGSVATAAVRWGLDGVGNRRSTPPQADAH